MAVLKIGAAFLFDKIHYQLFYTIFVNIISLKR